MLPTLTETTHEHLCLFCGKWSRATAETASCPRCRRTGPALHNAAQLLGAWGLNAFFEDQGVSEAVLDPAWAVRLRPGQNREEIQIEIRWTSLDGAGTKTLLRRWGIEIGLDPAPVFRRRTADGEPIWTVTEVYSLDSFSHPAGLYRLIATRIAMIMTCLTGLGDAQAEGTLRPKPPAAIGWAGEWLARFFAAPPTLDPFRLNDRYCPRCFHDQAGYYEANCSYFRDNPEIAWGSGTEPWYDLWLAASERFDSPELRRLVLIGPDGGLPPVPVDGPVEAFNLIGRVVAHYRPRRCPGFAPTVRVMLAISQWAEGEASLVEVVKNALDPLINEIVGDRVPAWLNELFEGRVSPVEKRKRTPSEVSQATTRLQNVAEWLSGGALESPRRLRGG